MPDYAAWGPDGSLYVTDYQQAVIWRVPPGGGTSQVWLADRRLDGVIFGTAGITLMPDHRTLVFDQASNPTFGGGNPTTGKLYAVPIQPDGRPGPLRRLWESGPAEAPDGFALARSGDIYMALVGVSNQVVELSPTGHQIARFGQALTGDNGSAVPFDSPSGVAFLGTKLIIANQSYFADNPANQALLALETGEEGQPVYVPARAGLSPAGHTVTHKRTHRQRHRHKRRHRRAHRRHVRHAVLARAAGAVGYPSLSVRSSRADLVAGGSAVVRLTGPRRVRVYLGARDITRAFARRSDGHVEAVVSGLRVGRNVLQAVVPATGRGARLIITNHPNGGPVFSGPQIKPWTCERGALDRKCDRPATYSYLYLPSGGSDLQPYDPAHPASNVATTTTDAGVRVPFIVREEIGYEDRDRYRIEVLWQPGRPWSRFSPQSQWNHKLLIMHGGSCHNTYAPTDPPFEDYSGTLPSAPPGVPDSSTVALGRGFAVGSTALDNSGVDCNPALQAESILMMKEHIWVDYGDIRFTIGTGCSGGSLAEQWMANAYPGLYQGLIAQCTFPDAGSTAQQIIDYALIANYFHISITSIPGAVLGELLASRGWTTAQLADITGDGVENLPVSANWAFSAYEYFQLADPEQLCGGITSAQLYQPQTNPGGVRCGIVDWNATLLGPRPPSVWDAQERAVGHGFTGLPIDDVGVQYGLGALEKGQISPQQFADLNAAIGGMNVDFRPQPQRTVADEPALGNAYRTGLIDEANHLNEVAIINLAGPNDPGIAHDSYRAFAVRARLDRDFGTHANQVMWQGPAPVIGDPYYTAEALSAMDRWLSAIDSDHGPRALPAKIVADKPADVTDQCSNGTGVKLHAGLCGTTVVPVYGTPRTVAGEPLTTDQNKCRLRPLNRAGYGSVHFTDAQWAELQRAFPSGVCDWSRPGVAQQPTVAWLTYLDGHGRAIIGGRPLGPPPVSRRIRAARST
jgi:hypothetical protein